jgi:hypothetical protein
MGEGDPGTMREPLQTIIVSIYPMSDDDDDYAIEASFLPGVTDAEGDELEEPLNEIERIVRKYEEAPAHLEEVRGSEDSNVGGSGNGMGHG